MAGGQGSYGGTPHPPSFKSPQLIMAVPKKKTTTYAVAVKWSCVSPPPPPPPFPQPKYTSGGSDKTPAEGKYPGVLAEEREVRMRAKRREKKREKRMLKAAQRETTESRGCLGSREGLPVVGKVHSCVAFSSHVLIGWQVVPS